MTGNEMAEKRKRLGLTQVELAAELHYDSAQTISNMENGRARVHPLVADWLEREVEAQEELERDKSLQH